ncbi:hypothetical protein HDU76_002437 [Blyttiomyces sp. JEL0837]|nr:hypothetical protein HDU76_002437 [Blyttiomyces sp. JEL0837]
MSSANDQTASFASTCIDVVWWCSLAPRCKGKPGTISEGQKRALLETFRKASRRYNNTNTTDGNITTTTSSSLLVHRVAKEFEALVQALESLSIGTSSGSSGGDGGSDGRDDHFVWVIVEWARSLKTQSFASDDMESTATSCGSSSALESCTKPSRSYLWKLVHLTTRCMAYGESDVAGIASITIQEAQDAESKRQNVQLYQNSWLLQDLAAAKRRMDRGTPNITPPWRLMEQLDRLRETLVQIDLNANGVEFEPVVFDWARNLGAVYGFNEALFSGLHCCQTV